MVFVEALLGAWQVGLGRPGLGHHHRQGVWQRTAGAHQKFQRVVEARGVGAAFEDHRLEVLHRRADVLVREQRFARLHAVDVATQGVDLAVVRREAERMRQIPGREGVGRVALVDQRQRGDRAHVFQVGEVDLDLLGQEHALVDDRLRRQRADVEIVVGGEVLLTHQVFGPLARQIERQFQTRQGDRAVSDKSLLHRRFVGLGVAAQRGVVGRHVAPAEEAQVVLAHRLLEGLHARSALGVVTRQENDSRAVLAGRWQFEAGHRAIERVGDLDHDARAVAVVGVGADRTAVGQVAEDLQAASDDVVALGALDVGEKADAAGVVFVLLVVKALGGRESEVRHDRVSCCWSAAYGVAGRSAADAAAGCCCAGSARRRR